MNYRKFYSQATGIEVPKEFHIHHIDFDRSNNQIKNLVALPKKLHQQYHFYYAIIKDQPMPTMLIMDYYTSYIFDAMESYIPIYVECIKWINHRDYLLGIIPKINTLNYD